MKERWRSLSAKQFNRDCVNVPVKRIAKKVPVIFWFSEASFGPENCGTKSANFLSTRRACVVRLPPVKSRQRREDAESQGFHKERRGCFRRCCFCRLRDLRCDGCGTSRTGGWRREAQASHG